MQKRPVFSSNFSAPAFLHFFSILSSSRHEKRCRMSERIFCLFQCSRNIQWVGRYLLSILIYFECTTIPIISSGLRNSCWETHSPYWTSPPSPFMGSQNGNFIHTWQFSFINDDRSPAVFYSADSYLFKVGGSYENLVGTNFSKLGY